MTEDERDDIHDLLPKDMILWSDDDELSWWKDDPWTFSKWRRVLEHEPAHPGCCKTCGCAASCMLNVFYGSVVDSVIRELDRIGALRKPAG